ncbi:MAG: hypothetical protein ACEQSL_08980, partial [Sediminibacterium sp.]
MGGLFKFSDLNSPPVPREPEASAYVSENKIIKAKGSATDVLKQIIKCAQPGVTVQFKSSGIFSMHELLRRLLDVNGSSDVLITTWAMTELPARAIKTMIDDAMISSLNCLFDFKTRRNCPKALQLAEGLATKIRFAHCHA